MVSLSINLDGGIGNLLFQYAAALTLHHEFEYDISFVELSPGLKERLESYVGEVEFEATQVNNSAAEGRSFLNQILKLSEIQTSRPVTKWVADFSPLVTPLPKRVRYLKGYFQHPSWYQSSLSTVLQKLVVHRDNLKFLIPTGLTSIHLRRSDYVRLGWALPLGYYEKAIEAAINLVQGPVAVFSDDRIVSELFSEHLLSSGYQVLQSDLSNQSAFNDFFTISNSETVVMSNSTFSWWAATLAKFANPSANIYCPANWIPTSGSEVLISSEWERID